MLQNLFSKRSSYSWRSLFSFIVIMTTSTILICFNKLESSDWVNLVQWVGGFFIMGEAARKFVPGKGSSDVQQENKEVISE